MAKRSIKGLDTRNKLVTIRFKEAEYEALKLEAKESGLRLPSYLRFLIMNQEREPINSHIEYSSNEIGKIDRFHINLKEPEKLYLYKQAESLGLNVRDYLLHVAKDQKVVRFPDNFGKDLKKLNTQLLKIGTNLNQLTKLANMGVLTSVNVDDLKSVYFDTLEKLNEIHEVIKQVT